jgi:hypothetical protein
MKKNCIECTASGFGFWVEHLLAQLDALLACHILPSNKCSVDSGLTYSDFIAVLHCIALEFPAGLPWARLPRQSWQHGAC